jgi:hypothetical protein
MDIIDLVMLCDPMATAEEARTLALVRSARPRIPPIDPRHEGVPVLHVFWVRLYVTDRNEGSNRCPARPLRPMFLLLA